MSEKVNTEKPSVGCDFDVVFAHTSAAANVSGVSSWLHRLAPELVANGLSTAVELRHYPSEAAPLFCSSATAKCLERTGVLVSGYAPPDYTEHGVSKAIDFLNKRRPRVFLYRHSFRLIRAWCIHIELASLS